MYDRKLFAMEDQVVVVTGAGDGIGRAIAETFASAGAAVMVSDLQVESASGVADHIESIGGRAVAAGCDITNEEDLERIVASAVDQFGKLTHVVSNAGGGGPNRSTCR